MGPSYLTTRPIALTDCPWLTTSIPANATMWPCRQNTFEYADSTTHIALCLNPEGDYPFYAIPRAAVTRHKQKTVA